MPPDMNLSEHVFRLLQNEPFFGAFSRRIHKRPSEAIETAGVIVNKETQQFEMLYNPKFFSKLSDNHIRGVLKHEFYHIILEHVTSRTPPGGLKKVNNIAFDLAINSYLIDELPSEADPGPIMSHGQPMVGCFPGEGIFKDLPPYKTYEWYLNALEDMSDEALKDTSDSVDDHSGFGTGENSNVIGDILKQRLSQQIKESVLEANSKSNGWGSIPSSMRKKIMEACAPSIDWRKVLRYFIKTSERADRRSTPRRINRRFPKIHPGKRIRRQSKIAISIDQSGSVNDRMLSLFFAELNKLSELATFTIIPFDTRVDESLVYTWKKGQKRTWERVMSGGTDFNPPTKYVNENGFDGHIILTDMMAPKPISSRCQRMWMTTEEYVSNPYFSTSERVIAIKR